MAVGNEAGGAFTLATRLLRKTALTADEANQLIEIIEEMASMEAIRMIERVEYKIEANAKVHDAHMRAIKWFIAVGIAVAGILASIAAMFFGTGTS